MSIFNFDEPPHIFEQLREGDLFYIRGAEKNLFLKTEEIYTNECMFAKQLIYNAVSIDSGRLILVSSSTNIIPVVVNAYKDGFRFVPIAY